MKKNANILEYVEKYKYKYGISYADEKSTLVRRLCKFINFFTICMIIWTFLFCMSLLFKAQSEEFSLFAVNNDYFVYTSEYYTLLACFFLLIVTLILSKKSKYFLGLTVAILPVAISCFRTCTKVGLGYKSSYYIGSVPSYIIMLLVVALIFILIRARIKTNRIYDMLVDGLYKQYGTENGEKLSEEDWQKFLKDYNPKKMFKDTENVEKNKSKTEGKK